MKRVALILAVLAAMLASVPVDAPSRRWSDVDQIVNSNLGLVRHYAAPWRSGPRSHPRFGWDNDYGYRDRDYYRPRWSQGRRDNLVGRTLGTVLVAGGAYALGRAHSRNNGLYDPYYSEPEPRRGTYEPGVHQGGIPFVRNSSGAQVQISCSNAIVDAPGLPEGVLRAGGKIENMPCSVDQIQAFGWFPDADDQRTVQEVRYTRTFSGGLLLYPPKKR